MGTALMCWFEPFHEPAGAENYVVLPRRAGELTQTTEPGTGEAGSAVARMAAQPQTRGAH